MLTTDELKRMFGKMRYWLFLPYVREHRWMVGHGTGFSDYTDNQILLGVILQSEVDQLYVFENKKRWRLRDIQREVKSFLERLDGIDEIDEIDEIDGIIGFQQELEALQKETGSLVEELKGISHHFAWLAHRFHGLTWKTPLLDKESKKWAELHLKARNAFWDIEDTLEDIQDTLDKHFSPGTGALFLQAEARFTEAQQKVKIETAPGP
jgi:hypothetical protein